MGDMHQKDAINIFLMANQEKISRKDEVSMRYVLKDGEEFVRWIQWTAGVVPHTRNGDFNKAMIIDDDYLNYEVEKTDKTRGELIKEYHPHIEVVKVTVSIVE